MTNETLSPCCVRAIVLRMQRFALFLSVANTFAGVMFSGWRWGLLGLVDIGIAFGKLWLLDQGDDMCPPGQLFAGIVQCDALQQAVRSFLSLYLFLILFMAAFLIYYSKVLTRYAKLLNEGPQALQDGRGAYGQVDGEDNA
ncbi:hypothetical protein HDU87_008457 [Geranomyces variabilis]|uniref:Uncharacterized protein n=1 Tax=Geranomyces variabilis TaxID=109894 RepID=A0AAD5TQV9_9FUNG|nr:hypothetical protein HDU87_008457 [Geranomyces variabilis]